MELIIRSVGDPDADIPEVIYFMNLYDYEFEDNDHKQTVLEAARELGVALTGEAVKVFVRSTES